MVCGLVPQKPVFLPNYSSDFREVWGSVQVLSVSHQLGQCYVGNRTISVKRHKQGGKFKRVLGGKTANLLSLSPAWDYFSLWLGSKSVRLYLSVLKQNLQQFPPPVRLAGPSHMIWHRSAQCKSASELRCLLCFPRVTGFFY